ncbi:MAG: 50S ribosomal protein L5 [Candidatus Altiarchaeota archaeon]
MNKENPMQAPRLEKVVVSISVGESGEKLVKAEKLLTKLTGRKPVRTVSKHKIPAWGLKKGEPIGCKVTLRGGKAAEFAKGALSAKESMLQPNNFDNAGNISFGLNEYIDLPGIKYDPEIGIMGMNVNLTLERPGYRIKRRRKQKTPIKPQNKIIQKEAIEYMEKNFGVQIEQEN